MAMTVLPSFQTFLQSAAQAPRPLSPLQPQSPVLAQPHFQFHFQAQASPQQQQQQQSPSDGHRSPLAFPSTSDLRTAAIQDTHSFVPAVWKTGPLSVTSSGLASRSYTSAFSCSSEEDVDESDDEDHYHQDQRLLQRARARAESFVYRHRATSPSNARRYVTPMATSFVAASPTSTSSASVDSSSSGAKRVKKKYLKERERCEIVRRVRAGEKQAHLAKEFGVSRAAVCYLLKHQMEILRRSAQRL